MKNIFMAPLLSAFVLPGLGQVINGQVRKAGLLIAAVTILFLTLFVKLLYDLNKFFLSLPPESYGKNSPTLSTAAQTLSRQDNSLVTILGLLLTGVWVYGIWDAFSVARKKAKDSSKCANI
jgi:hypothetical protein